MQPVVRNIATSALLLWLIVPSTQAQQSMTAEFDSCITSEKVSYTLKGAATGAMAGFLGNLAAGQKQDKGKAVLVGAVAGGALGFATAYYKAADICIKKNPTWVPESNIQRNPNFGAVVKEFKYKPSQGDFSVVRPLQVPESVKPGESINVKVRFVVLTADGGEAKVKILRQLFVLADGKEEEVPFFGKGSEEKIFENGEHTDSFVLPFDKEIPLNSKVKIQYAISLKDAPVVAQSGVVEVR